MALPQSVKLLADLSVKKKSVKFVKGPSLTFSPEQPKLMRSFQMYRGKCQWKSMIEYKYIFWEVHSSGKCIYSVCAAILRLLKLWFELPFRFKCCWPPSIIQIKPDFFGIEESILNLIIMMKFKLILASETGLFGDKFLACDQSLLKLHMLLFSEYWQSLKFESRRQFCLTPSLIHWDRDWHFGQMEIKYRLMFQGFCPLLLPPISQSLPLQEN